MKIRDAMSFTIQSTPSTSPSPVTALHGCRDQCRFCRGRAGEPSTREPHTLTLAHTNAMNGVTGAGRDDHAPQKFRWTGPGLLQSPPMTAHQPGHGVQATWVSGDGAARLKPNAPTHQVLLVGKYQHRCSSKFLWATTIPKRRTLTSVSVARRERTRLPPYLRPQQLHQLCLAVPQPPSIGRIHDPNEPVRLHATAS